ncbi:MAG TPA: TIGR03557 family F420-dependent LLM class oxidoreductase [Chloroflexota bacterium]|nr:TIGR03557 family F420-dependent LLM class oxidoreductase [Chloroflexota bacterium]
MPDLRIGFFLSHEQFSPPELLELAVAAGEAGFDELATSDHFHPWQHNQGHSGQAWITLAAIGQAVPRIPFGTTVTCPSYRYHPAVVAQAFATLATLYPGRVFLGLGTGEAFNEQPLTGQFGNFQERHDRLDEAAQIIRRMWSGEWTSFNGQYYQIKDARLYDPPPEPIPLLIAASGPKSIDLAGRRGDGWITDSESVRDPRLVDAFRQAHLGSGRIMVEQFAVVGGQKEAHEAAEVWRFQPIGFTELLSDPDPRSVQRRAEEKLTLDDVAAKFLVSEDPSAHAQRIRKLASAGATDIIVHTGQHDQLRMIRFYEREVLPMLRGSQGGQKVRETVGEGVRTEGSNLMPG